MKILVVGATGATGQHVVSQFLERGHDVKVIVRSNISTIKGTVLDMADADIVQHDQSCDALACCLGHNLSFHGIFGHPRKLVTESVRRLCEAVQANISEKPIKFILMNSAGCRNRGISENISLAQRCVISLLRFLLPPHADNEKAADYLRTKI